jgi:hypothetical protein
MFVPVCVEEVVLQVEHEDESWHRVLSAFFGPRRAFANKLMRSKTKYLVLAARTQDLIRTNPIARKTQAGG